MSSICRGFTFGFIPLLWNSFTVVSFLYSPFHLVSFPSEFGQEQLLGTVRLEYHTSPGENRSRPRAHVFVRRALSIKGDWVPQMEIESKFTTGLNATFHPNPHFTWPFASPFLFIFDFPFF